MNNFVIYPEHLVQKMETAFQQSSVVYKKKPLPIGATDGSAFAINGLPALSIIGMDSTKYDPCYHTRLDNLEHLDPKGLEAMKTVMINFINNKTFYYLLVRIIDRKIHLTPTNLEL